MIKRVLVRAIGRIPGGLLAYVVAYLVFEDQNYAAIAAVSYMLGNWFNAASVLIVIAAARIITDNLNYSYLAGLVFEIGARVYVTTARLKNGEI